MNNGPLTFALARRDQFIRSIVSHLEAIKVEDGIIGDLVQRPEVDDAARAKAAEEIERQDADLAAAVVPSEETLYVG